MSREDAKERSWATDRESTFTIPRETVERACQLNNIDKPSRQVGLQVLKDAGRVDEGELATDNPFW